MVEVSQVLLRNVAEALYYVGFEAKPANVNYFRCQELYLKVSEILRKWR